MSRKRKNTPRKSDPSIKSKPTQQSPTHPAVPWRLFALLAATLVLITAIAFSGALQNGFVYDDTDYVTQNPQVRSGLSLRSITWAFTAIAAGNWHPITWLSHMLDCHLYGLNPLGHHLTNLLFHIANSLLLLYLLLRLTTSPWKSAS